MAEALPPSCLRIVGFGCKTREVHSPELVDIAHAYGLGKMLALVTR